MNPCEEFDAFAKRFNARYHYLPFGKDTLQRPDVVEVLIDLARTFHELEVLKTSASSSDNKASTPLGIAVHVQDGI